MKKDLTGLVMTDISICPDASKITLNFSTPSNIITNPSVSGNAKETVEIEGVNCGPATEPLQHFLFAVVGALYNQSRRIEELEEEISRLKLL